MPSCSRGTGGTPGCSALLGVPGWRAVAPGTASLQVPVSAGPGEGSPHHPPCGVSLPHTHLCTAPAPSPCPGGSESASVWPGCPGATRPRAQPASGLTRSLQGRIWGWSQDLAMVCAGSCGVTGTCPVPLVPPSPASSPSPPPPLPQHSPHSLRSSSVLSRGSDADLPLVTVVGATLPRAGGLGSLRRAQSHQHPAGPAAGLVAPRCHHGAAGRGAPPRDPTPLMASLGTPGCPPAARLLSPPEVPLGFPLSFWGKAGLCRATYPVGAVSWGDEGPLAAGCLLAWAPRGGVLPSG